MRAHGSFGNKVTKQYNIHLERRTGMRIQGSTENKITQEVQPTYRKKLKYIGRGKFKLLK